ncbi:eukaryotic translation initiation factor 4E-binding protein Mextli isoform X2 [Lutzomyia longipalpis]|uniref:eukaryotic translation initiation factor 4E-binding protein Mextli isoform X2 n=1 Tax=Lutzomyia longipalpis TaxID=7200 RepID=UPI0024838EAF|nr:eukaryotic translation initiation factor 4E-binding protein Mextli isoform X2 [Lutzomyia longipalpis]XP_055681542.1 eukaryotic translation initiation factor 4E-binding protein Mextli isoform X2 [Lutzomyia longipalpis]
MSQIGRTTKNLDGTRALKGSVPRQPVHTQQMYEIQTVDQLIELIEIVAASLASASVDSGKMNTLLSNLRIYGPQLEALSKDVLDKAFVTFRNASQDERLNIMTRLNLLELIELRAKSWQISDEVNTYYKHKATNVEPAFIPSASDLTLLSTSPTELMGQTQPAILAPGELLRNSGKFTKPTKIPGKNYSKDEVVIRNADSGKVNPGAKERLVQITGPNEEKINYAKQLIEDTIRRNASPVRLETAQGGGSCSSLASSASDETQNSLRAARNSIGAAAIAVMAANQLNNNPFLPGQGVVAAATQSGIQSQVPSGVSGGKLARGSGVPTSGQLLLHSYSTNDASLGEYKFTVNVGPHSIKITGDRCDLVRAAKLVLDDYFSSTEFLASIDAGMGGSFDATIPSYTSHQGGSVSSTPLNPYAPPVVPMSHQLGGQTSPFADSGIGLNLLAQSASGSPGNGLSIDADDDVFTAETCNTSTESSSSNASSNNSIVTSTPSNGLTRSRRSHFSRQESTPEALTKDTTSENQVRIVHEYEDLISFAKSPLAWALPKDWTKICEKYPTLVRNKVLHRFHSLNINNNHINNANDDDSHIAEGARKALLARQASLNCDRFDISSSQSASSRVASVAPSSVNNRLNVAHIASTAAGCD